MSELVSLHRRGAGMNLLASSPRNGKLPTPTKEKPIIISASELRDFLRCRVRWNWRHQERLTPVGGAPALDMGTLVHEILESWYKLDPSGRGPKAMTKIAKSLIKRTTLQAINSEDKELVEAMCIGYAEWAREADREIGLKTCFAEEPFDLPLTDSGRIRVRGRLDLRFVPTNLKKVMAIQDIKTASQFRDNQLELNYQLSVYLWAMRQLHPGMRDYIAYYTQMRKQLPGPRVKADLFTREPVSRTDEEIAQWAIDAENAALDMLDAAIYPHPLPNCGYDCDFRNPCMLRGRPEDLKYVLSTQFKQKERR